MIDNIDKNSQKLIKFYMKNKAAKTNCAIYLKY